MKNHLFNVFLSLLVGERSIKRKLPENWGRNNYSTMLFLQRKTEHVHVHKFIISLSPYLRISKSTLHLWQLTDHYLRKSPQYKEGTLLQSKPKCTSFNLKNSTEIVHQNHCSVLMNKKLFHLYLCLTYISFSNSLTGEKEKKINPPSRLRCSC